MTAKHSPNSPEAMMEAVFAEAEAQLGRPLTTEEVEAVMTGGPPALAAILAEKPVSEIMIQTMPKPAPNPLMEMIGLGDIDIDSVIKRINGNVDVMTANMEQWASLMERQTVALERIADHLAPKEDGQ